VQTAVWDRSHHPGDQSPACMDLLNPTSGKAVVDVVHWKEFTTETVLPSSEYYSSIPDMGMDCL
jgi:hypothetical protein